MAMNSESDKLREQIRKMEFRTIYSEAHHTGVRVQLTESSIDQMLKFLTTHTAQKVAEADRLARIRELKSIATQRRELAVVHSYDSDIATEGRVEAVPVRFIIARVVQLNQSKETPS